MNSSQSVANKVCRTFFKNYGRPRLGNKINPLDEYLYILLSLRTTYWSFEKVYCDFKRKFPRWEDVYKSPRRSVARAIKDAGLSNQKASHIKSALKAIKKDFGELSLRKLKTYKDDELEEYLLKLPGLGVKAARCIMMYSLGREVLPVDTHTQRVSKRLGFIRNVDNSKAHQRLDQVIPKNYRYVYHVGCVVHGRTTCLYKNPKCEECAISSYCKYFKKFRKQ